MSNVVITARTRVSDSEICLGGIDVDAVRSVRLSTANARNFSHHAPFDVGSVWSMEYTPRSQCIAPHVEDVNVHSYEAASEQPDFGELLTNESDHLHVWRGGPDALFNGLLSPDSQANRQVAGGLYVFDGQPIPPVSLGYWIPDRDLRATRSRRRSGRYGYDIYHVDRSGPSSTVKIVHSGLRTLPSVIPSGAILSLSLARWWAPRDDPDRRRRCTLQVCDLLWVP